MLLEIKFLIDAFKYFFITKAENVVENSFLYNLMPILSNSEAYFLSLLWCFFFVICK